MAKKSKPQQSKTASESLDDQTIEPMVPADETPDNPAEDVETPEDTGVSADMPDEDVPTPAEVAEDGAPQVEETLLAEAAPEDDDDLQDEPVPEHMDSAVIAPQHQDSASNSVLLPALLGGLIAAGIGFTVAYYMVPRAEPGLNETVAGNTAEVSALRDQIAALSAEASNIDFGPISEDLSALREQVTAEFEDVGTQLAAFDERLLTLEKQPSGDGTLQDTALQAYQRELDELRSQVEEQAGAALAQLESTRAEAAAIEQAALDAARAAQVRAALAQVQTGLSNGEPIEAALTDLEVALGEPVPEALMAVSEGAPTLAGLQAAFPDVARAALADARAGGESGEDASAFGAFLREQLNVRSVAPRDGDDADAILSRAQAAVSEGKLQVAIDEIATLPDVAQAKLAEWVATAETRVAAINAADAISLSLNVN